MPSTICLPNHYELNVNNPNIIAYIEGNEVTFELGKCLESRLSRKFALFSSDFNFESSATVLGDGFQMLCQTTGTVADPVPVGRCPDNSASYRIYDASEPQRYYNYLVVEDASGYTLYGFTSCFRYAGFFEVETVDGQSILHAYLDGEEIELCPSMSNKLESVVVLTGLSLSDLYAQYADLIAAHHPPRMPKHESSPIGWCSWYAYYEQVSESLVQQNLNQMQGELGDIEWVLIDDGYQAFMGDWLSPSEKFSRGIESVVKDIIAKGKRPAIWLAPFIAQPESHVFQMNPDWFVRIEGGGLLKAEEVTYGGWRCTPWYILDTTNPSVQAHLASLSRYMHQRWGIELFKLDANYWGTLRGKRHQAGVTGVEAYRMGLQALISGAPNAKFIGCNAPMWPSLGLVDAMRVSDDVERHGDRFIQIARETFFRSWQHNKLWWIDPDCVTLTSLPHQQACESEYDFHRTAMLASSGVLMSGDPLMESDAKARQTFKRLMLRQKINTDAAKFTALSLNHAFLRLSASNDLHCLFNYRESEASFTLTANSPVNWFDFWTGEKLNESPCQLLSLTLRGKATARAIVTR